jgi:hypothetical protein
MPMDVASPVEGVASPALSSLGESPVHRGQVTVASRCHSLKTSLLKFVLAMTLPSVVASLLDAWYASGGGVLQREVGAATSGDVARQR